MKLIYLTTSLKDSKMPIVFSKILHHDQNSLKEYTDN